MGTEKEEKQIVVVGAGYAGLTATVRIARQARHSGAAITLVNGTDYFVERLRLHQVAANQNIRRHSLASILKGTQVKIVQGWVEALQPEQHTITVRTTVIFVKVGRSLIEEVWAIGNPDKLKHV